MRSGVSAGGKAYVCLTATERAAKAAASRKAAGGGKVESWQFHPANTDVEYTPEEWEFIAAVHEYQSRSGKKFPTWREIYHIFEGLGYGKSPGGEPGAVAMPVMASA